MPYEQPEIETDVDAVTDRIIDGMMDAMDGWEPVEGAPEVALAEEVGREVADLRQDTIDALEYAAAGVGETVFRFASFPGAPATIAAAVTVTGPGAIIPAGFTVVGLNGNGDEVEFTLGVDVGVPSGTVATVVLTATEPGEAGNRVPTGPLTIVTVTTAVVEVVATDVSTGGADAEPIDVYLERLSDYLGTLRPGGVRADDLAALARTVPGVYRALGIDLYDPTIPSTTAERTASVACVDITGHPVSTQTATQVRAVLEDAREVNFQAFVIGPTYAPVAIEYTAVAETGADPAVVEVEVNAALAGWLTRWGAAPADPQAWVNTPTVRYLDVAKVAGSAPGVAFLQTLTVNGATVDVTLPGPAPMPAPLDDTTAPSTIAGTVLT